jgi:hypothetical protein
LVLFLLGTVLVWYDEHGWSYWKAVKTVGYPATLTGLLMGYFVALIVGSFVPTYTVDSERRLAISPANPAVSYTSEVETRLMPRQDSWLAKFAILDSAGAIVNREIIVHPLCACKSSVIGSTP